MARRDRMDVTEGTLHGGLAYLARGSGPVLLDLVGLEPVHANPTGAARPMELSRLAPLAASYHVHSVHRPPGLAPGTTMADLARVHAEAITHEFGGPVDVLGTSTGGSVALQLAVDHPHLVRRLVLLASACRLSEHGREVQRAYAADVLAGRGRRGSVRLGRIMAATVPGEVPLGLMMWAVAPMMTPDDPSDLLRTIEAEDAFDVSDRLGEVTARTLVVGGARDRFYGAELFRRTAAGIGRSQLRLHPRDGHFTSVTSRRVRADILRFLDVQRP